MGRKLESRHEVASAFARTPGLLNFGTLGLAAAALSLGVLPARAADRHDTLPPHRVAHPAPHHPVRHVVHAVAWHPPAAVHLPARQENLAHKPLVRHLAWRHAPVRHPIWHHPVWHHAVWHRPIHAGPRMSCVPFARAASGIDVAGNAYAWWGNAAGRYARGDAPVPGSVLAFRANMRMRLGHVAVVSRVINRREIEVDQANWADWGQITRGVKVIDVSEDNSWTDVRVALGDGRFGSVYPTYGFIYDRPDTGTMMAANRRPAPVIAANPAPADLRPIDRGASAEVAEAPGRLPAPPRWPTHLGHTLHTRFVHHAAYTHHEASHGASHGASHWAPHRAPIHHVTVRHAPVHSAMIHHATIRHVATHHAPQRPEITRG